MKSLEEAEDLLLQVEDLSVKFENGGFSKEALFNINLSLKKKESVAILGQLGSGKSTLSKAIMRLLPENASLTCKKLSLEGSDLLVLSQKELSKFRGSKLALIPEDSLNALNPVVRLSTQIEEGLIYKKGLSKSQAEERAKELIREVGISPERLDEFPGNLSGGMKQRAVIAIALSLEPSLLLADEPCSALDVTVQMVILNLLNELRLKYNSSLILFTSNLFIATRFSDRVLVLENGRIVESCPSYSFIKEAKEPYSKKYIEASLGLVK